MDGSTTLLPMFKLLEPASTVSVGVEAFLKLSCFIFQICIQKGLVQELRYVPSFSQPKHLIDIFPF